MPSLINRVPRGLLDFLQIKALGKNPSVLVDEVRPTIQLRDLYLLGQECASTQAAATSSAGVGQRSAITVPQAEYWYVQQLTVASVALAAGEILSMAPGILTVTYQNTVPPGVPAAHSGPVGDFTTGTVGYNVSCSARTPFWLGPGDSVGPFVQILTTAGTVLLTTRILYYPFRN